MQLFKYPLPQNVAPDPPLDSYFYISYKNMASEASKTTQFIIFQHSFCEL